MLEYLGSRERSVHNGWVKLPAPRFSRAFPQIEEGERYHVELMHDKFGFPFVRIHRVKDEEDFYFTQSARGRELNLSEFQDEILKSKRVKLIALENGDLDIYDVEHWEKSDQIKRELLTTLTRSPK
ncbi:hypothetical protein HYT24_01120 [Candidatus Pacearchaeota archaeon]|nr:hypothetical protein [Candidatus Pacearchaeota archaeon]